MHTFPEGFVWGAASAPHQVEGNNVNSDFRAYVETATSILGGVEGVCTINEPNMLAIMVREAEATLDPDAGLEWLSPTLAADTPRPVKPAPPVEIGRRLVEAHHAARDVLPDVPIVVTENGIATDDDSRRIAYTTGALSALSEAMDDGVDETFERRPKPSLAWLGGVAKANAL
jgi:hypothetical protein